MTLVLLTNYSSSTLVLRGGQTLVLCWRSTADGGAYVLYHVNSESLTAVVAREGPASESFFGFRHFPITKSFSTPFPHLGLLRHTVGLKNGPKCRVLLNLWHYA